MKPNLEHLESRCSPTGGIADPAIVVVGLDGAPTAAIAQQTAALGMGHIADVVDLKSFTGHAAQYGADNMALAWGFMTHQLPYEGPDTVYELVLPPGVKVPGIDGDTTARELSNVLGGQFPVIEMPSELPGYSPFPGGWWEETCVNKGWFTNDPNAATAAQIPPGPGTPLPMRPPEPALGWLAVDYLFAGMKGSG